jgi:hypothetical protein
MTRAFTDRPAALIACMTEMGPAHHRWEKCWFCDIPVCVSKDGTKMIDAGKAQACCILCAIQSATPEELEEVGGFKPDGTTGSAKEAYDAWRAHLKGVNTNGPDGEA